MTTQPGGQLGEICSWTSPASVKLTVLRQSMTSVGLPESLLRDMQPKNALRRAFSDMKKDRVIKEVEKGKFQFTKEHLNTMGKEYEYNREAFVTITDSGDVASTDPVIQAEARRLMAEHLENRSRNDVTRLVKRIFETQKADLIPITPSGYAYFVPDQHQDLVDKVRQLLKLIGGQLLSFAVRLGSADTSASVAQSMAEYMLGLVKEFRESCSDMNLDAPKSVVSRRFEKLKELRSKLDCYRGLMQGMSGRIENEINSSDRLLMARLNPATQPSAAMPEMQEA